MGDNINKAISYSNSILYSACFSVIYSMGFLPSVGFIHSGTMIDFCLDLADVFKNDLAIDPAFRSISNFPQFDRDNLKALVCEKLDKEDFFKKSSVLLSELFE